LMPSCSRKTSSITSSSTSTSSPAKGEYNIFFFEQSTTCFTTNL
jgi:hypothetical protein